MAGPSVWPLLAAVFTAGFFVILTIQGYTPALISGVLAIVCMLRWLWETDRPVALAKVDVGAGIEVPTYVTGPISHGWWAMVILLIVIGMIYLMTIFSFVFLYGIHPQFWRKSAEAFWLLPIVGGYGAAAGLVLLGRHLLARPGTTRWSPIAPMLAGVAALAIAFVVDFSSWRSNGLDPELSAQGALVHAFLAQQGMLVGIALLMAVYLAARNSRGLVTRPRNTTFDVITLFLLYCAAQGGTSAMLTRLFPGSS